MIHILWPTVRPAKMLKTLDHWMEMSSGKHDINLTVAVNTEADGDDLQQSVARSKIMVTGTERLGPVLPVYKLGRNLINKNHEHSDVVIVISDDFFSFKDWDEWITNELKGTTAGLMVHDGYQKREGRAMTLPIMTFGALKALNGIIYHPDYHWEFCDNELFENLTALGMLKETRDGGPTFRHEHWVTGHRVKDEHDMHGASKSPEDKATFERRMKLSLEERLK